ncbi:MAG TPA: beta-propeller fold lactonase family protein [Acidimicrobiales bacterium]|jgi:hypothetical protein
MGVLRRVGVYAGAAAALLATGDATLGSAASAIGAPAQGWAPPAVFVQTDNPAGNQVVAYRRAGDGTLVGGQAYATGGLGGVVNGSQVDHLASEGSLAYDPAQSALLAVNAGSNTVSLFAVHGDQLQLRQVVASGGSFPVSIAVRGDLVYVLNALGGGSVAGYVLSSGHLQPIPGWTRPLGLGTTPATTFTATPGQVAFSPDGRQLLVTTKGTGNAIDVFGVGWFGNLSAAPVVNVEPGAVPFGVSFDGAGRLLVAEAGPNAVQSFALLGNGTLTPIATLATGQAATCWITGQGASFFVSNAGSGDLSDVRSIAGHLTGSGTTATDPGTVDATLSGDGQFLYVQTGASGIVDEYHVNPGGTLTQIGAVTVPGSQGGEGIAAG